MTAFVPARTLLTVLTLAITGSFTPSAADDMAECNNERHSFEMRIAACSKVVQAGSVKDSDLNQARGHLADAYRRAGQYERALAEYSKLRSRTGGGRMSPYVGSALVYIDLGQRERAAAELNQAIQFYSEAIQREPSAMWHYGWRAFGYQYTGAFDLAIADYDTAITLDPSFAFWRRNRAMAHFYKGDLTKAHAELTEILQRDPKDHLAHTMRGRVYEQARQFDHAIVDHDAAIGIDPKLAMTYTNRGRAFEGLGAGDRAQADFETAIKLHPHAGLPYIATGVIFEQGGRLEQALAEFEAALRLQPNLLAAIKGRDRIKAAIAAGSERK